jgi:6-phosphogluconolactonase (cycloisomerase 2 family)
MRVATRLGELAVGATAATVLIAVPANAATTHRPAHHAGPTHAVFVQNDSTTGNQVIAYRENGDGTLTQRGTYNTGGTGVVLPNSVVDHTASQGAVTYDAQRHQLYVVNAGSNSLSVFSVRGDRLRLRQVIGSGGQTPVSVAVHGHQVFVLNGNAGASIQGYLVAGDRLISVPSWNRNLGLTGTSADFTDSPGQVVFSPSGSELLVSTKHNTSSIYAYPLDEFGTPARNPVITSDPGANPFSLAFEQDGTLAATAGTTPAVSTFSLGRNGRLIPLAVTPTGQGGTCWVVVDGSLVFTTNPGAGSVTSLRVGPHGTLTVLGSTPTDAGTVDPAVSADGRYLYVETGAAGIVDEFAIHGNGSLSEIGTVTVPDGVGAEGIATS